MTLTYFFCLGWELTTAQIADRFDCTERTARRMIDSISRVVPIYQDEPDQPWKLLKDWEPDETWGE